MIIPGDFTQSHSIYDQSYPDLVKILDGWGEEKYRTGQIWAGLYHQLWNEPVQFTNLNSRLRGKLAEHYTFNNLVPIADLHSKDGETNKILFQLPDQKSIETVLMRYANRRTLCISTQAGCAMGCVFCATGQMGFKRNLTSGEIVEQVMYFARQLKLSDDGLTNIVLMGMGEPFHNYDASLAAIDRLNDANGFNFGARRFTISTVGIIPAIKRFTAEDRQINLAISLHAADDELRNELLPIGRKYPIDELMAACQEYVNQTHRRITFEWALIQGVNDSVDQAQKLAQRLLAWRHIGRPLCHVNVIPLNPTRKYSGKATQAAQAKLFQSTLESSGISCTIRIRRGIDIQAGCGQLATNFGEK